MKFVINGSHIKCPGFTKTRFQQLATTLEPWYCRDCTMQNTPFSSLDNQKMNKFLDLNPNPPLSPAISFDTFVYNHECSVCSQKIKRPIKAIPCKTCNNLIHRTCTYFKSSEFNILKPQSTEIGNV